MNARVPHPPQKSMTFINGLFLRGVWFLLLCLLAFTLVGCARREDDELSERPWNSPKRWENGLPSAITEGR